MPLACKSLSYWDPGANTDAGASEGTANVADPTSTDPASTNTDGHWVTPSGRVTLSIGSSVQDIRRTATVTLRVGTCAENSDIASSGSGGGSSPGAAAAPGARTPAASPGRVEAHRPAGAPRLAGKVICHSAASTRVLCTLRFKVGSWARTSVAARRAQLRLVKGGRTFAKGKAVLKSGKVRVRLESTRKVRPGRYELRIRVRGKTTSAKVKILSPRNRAARV